MFDLFKSEWLRLRMWAIALAVVHLAVLGFLSRVVDLAQQPLLVHWVIGGVHALSGLLLGLYQMGTYRKPSQWMNLLHRPLPHWRVATALAAASAVLLLVTIALPVLIVATYQETMTARVVDLRHWLLPLSGWLIALCAYLAGGFCSLRGVRHAPAAVVLLVWLVGTRAYGFGMIAIEVMALSWLAAMFVAAFKPDLSAPPRGALATVMTALPLQMGLYLLLLVGIFGVEMLWIALGSHPNNTGTPPRGGHNAVEKLDDRGRMLAALQGSMHPDAPLLREQIALSEPLGIASQVHKLPQAGELANVRPMEFDDEARTLRWVYSHDDRQLHGYSIIDQHHVGVIGVGPEHAPFPAPALPGAGMPGLGDGDAVLVAGNTLYQYVSETQQVLPRIVLPRDEVLTNAGPVGPGIAAMSDRALYFYDGRAFVEDRRVVVPRLRVPMPGKLGDLRNLELIELVDGYLIALSYSARAHTAAGAVPYQAMLRVHDDGRVEQLAHRTLRFDYPAWYRYQGAWPSPVLHALGEGARNLLAPPLPLDVTAPAPVPRGIVWLSLTLMLVAAIAAGWRSRRIDMSPSARVGWIVACMVIGLPAFAAMWLMLPLREVEDAVALPAPISA